MTKDKPAHDEHERIDGCLCGLDHSEHEHTRDEDLPPATGGVEGDHKPPRRKTSKA